MSVFYSLVVICVSQFLCSDASISMYNAVSLADCIKALHEDDAHRAFCVPMPPNKSLPLLKGDK